MKNALSRGEFVQAIEVPLPAAGAAVARLQDHEALRPRHLRASAPASRSSSTATRCATCAFAFGGMAATVEARARRPRPRCSARPWNEATRARRAGRRSAQRLHAAHRHARERRLPPAGGAEPAAPLLARDAAGRAAAGAARSASGARCACRPHAPRRSHADEPRSSRSWHGAPARRAAGGRRRRRIRTSRRTCTSPARRPTSTTCPSSPARCTRRSACRRWRTAGCRRSISTRCARCRASSRCSPPPTFPAPNDCGPIIHDDPILADGDGPVPRPAGVRGDRRDARRRAARRARRRRRRSTIEPLPPVLTPQEAHAAQSVRAAADAPGARRRRAPRSPPRRTGWPATLDVGGQEQFYLEGQISLRDAAGGRRHARLLLDAASERDAAPGRARAAACVRTRCRSSAGAWAAASAARNRSRRSSPASPRSRRSKLAPAGQAARSTATTTS